MSALPCVYSGRLVLNKASFVDRSAFKWHTLHFFIQSQLSIYFMQCDKDKNSCEQLLLNRRADYCTEYVRKPEAHPVCRSNLIGTWFMPVVVSCIAACWVLVSTSLVRIYPLAYISTPAGKYVIRQFISETGTLLIVPLRYCRTSLRDRYELSNPNHLRGEKNIPEGNSLTH